jgi:hypothetical protein
MPNFLCPHCNEEATCFRYSARTSGYESGTAEWDDTTDCVTNLSLNTEDSESGDIDDDTLTYECPNCNEELSTDQIQEFLTSRDIVRVQRQPDPYVRVTIRQPLGEPGFKFLSMQGNETLEDNRPQDRQTTTLPLGANQMGMCDRCGRAYISNSAEDECPHCS